MASGQMSDLEINNHIRRLLTKRRIDVTKVTYRTSSGVVFVGGDLVFIGFTKEVDELPKELALIEEMVRSIRGVRNVKIEFDDFEKDDVSGEWIYKGKELTKDEKIREKIKDAKEKGPQADVKKMIMQDMESFEDAGVLRAEALAQIMTMIEKITIRCPDCGIEYKYCLTCGTKLKIEIIPKIDSSLLPDMPEESVTTSAAAPSGPSTPMSLSDLAEMEDEVLPPKKDVEQTEDDMYPDETPEERRRRKLREKALNLLKSSRESKITGAAWKSKRPAGGDIDFDDF